MGANGDVHVAYASAYNVDFDLDPNRASQLRYALKDGTGWHVDIVDRTGQASADTPRIDLGPDGHPRIAYYYKFTTQAGLPDPLSEDVRFAEPLIGRVADAEQALGAGPRVPNIRDVLLRALP